MLKDECPLQIQNCHKAFSGRPSNFGWALFPFWVFFSLFRLLVSLGDGFESALDAFFVGFDLLFVTEREFDRRARKIAGFADGAFEVALVAPVDKFEVGAVDDEPWWCGVGLDDVTEFWMGVFESGWWV